MGIEVSRFVAPRAESNQPKDPREDPLDKILKGLKIIETGFGIYTNYEKLGLLERQTAADEAYKKAQAKKALQPPKPIIEFKTDVVDPETAQQKRIVTRTDPITGKTEEVGRVDAGFNPQIIAGRESMAFKGAEAYLEREHKKDLARKEAESKKDLENLRQEFKKKSDEAERQFKVKIEAIKSVMGKDGKGKGGDDPEFLTAKEKIAKLNSSDKDKLGKMASAYSTVEKMQKAVEKGISTTSSAEILRGIPFFGDTLAKKFGKENYYTIQALAWEEMISRLQSGAAITKDEADRFRAMIPVPGDGPKEAAVKFNTTREMLEVKFRTLGLEPKEAMSVLLGREPSFSPPKPASQRDKAESLMRREAAPQPTSRPNSVDDEINQYLGQ